MVSVTMKITINVATMMKGTVVDPMSIQHFALNVNALSENSQLTNYRK